MKQEDKDLLIKDLCARLPYGTCIDIYGCIARLISIDPLIGDGSINYTYAIDEVKPYLFPLSSMTEEQKKEFRDIVFDDLNNSDNTYDWLNAHHFDFRNLIDRKLAIDATNLNIY